MEDQFIDLSRTLVPDISTTINMVLANAKCFTVIDLCPACFSICCIQNLS